MLLEIFLGVRKTDDFMRLYPKESCIDVFACRMKLSLKTIRFAIDINECWLDNMYE